MIESPGLYDIALSEYLSDPCISPSFSASCGKTALQLSPLHAWLGHPRLGATAQPPSVKADFGSVVHELVLGNGSQFRVMEFDDFRTKAARDARAEAIAEGLVPIKASDLERAHKAAEVIRRDVAEVFKEGAAEQTMIWRDGDIWCRARPDWLVTSADMVFDLKITGVNISPLENTLARQIFAMWYDMTVAHYADGYRTLFGRELEYRFLFVEDHPPFSIRPFKISGQGLEMGERKLRAARSIWKTCIHTGQWPGIKLSLETADPEPWHAAGWLTYDTGVSDADYATALEMQAPLENA
jgi:hypothetical protein